jgi:hypothetical protein
MRDAEYKSGSELRKTKSEVYLYEQARIPRMDATMLENTNQNRKR